VDFDKLLKDDLTRFSPYQFVDGNRFYTAFTHLTGYSSNYYTYVFDKVIAVDFFAAFDEKQLLDGPAALRYRKAVLEPGIGWIESSIHHRPPPEAARAASKRPW
jgi:thimet oligopeptidase